MRVNLQEQQYIDNIDKKQFQDPLKKNSPLNVSGGLLSVSVV